MAIKRPKWANSTSSAAILFDMAIQYDIKNPTNRVLLRNNIKNHFREQEFLTLLDAEEKERREHFVYNINLMLDDGIFPFKAFYDWYFSKYCFNYV